MKPDWQRDAEKALEAGALLAPPIWTALNLAYAGAPMLSESSADEGKSGKGSLFPLQRNYNCVF